MKIILILLAFFVSACTRVVEKPVQVPVEIAVPVREYCATDLPAVPVYETSFLQANDSLCRQVDALLIERNQREIYTQKLKAILKGCVAPK